MDVVCHYCIVVLADDKQPPTDGIEVQRPVIKKQFTGYPAAANFAFTNHPFSMDCSPANFYQLHYFIFGFQKKAAMIYTAQVKVMPLKDLLDPQGKAVLG